MQNLKTYTTANHIQTSGNQSKNTLIEVKRKGNILCIKKQIQKLYLTSLKTHANKNKWSEIQNVLV
jgi:hypothetical protein